MAEVKLNSVFLFSPSQAVSESRIFEQEYHFLRYLFYKNAGTKKLFLQHDFGIDDPQRIMVFGLEKALDGLVQIVKWAIRGSVKKLTALFKPTSLMPL